MRSTGNLRSGRSHEHLRSKCDQQGISAQGEAMSTTLVTGGTGFLGQYVVDELLARGERVRVLARAPVAALREKGVELAIGDVARDLEGAPPLARALDGCETVYHLAGFVSRDPDDGQR